MQVKIFSANELHTALAMANRKLGPDVIILERTSTRDSAGKKIWHVHAAIDDPAPAPRPVNEPPSRIQTSMARLESIIDGLERNESGRLRENIRDEAVRQAFDRLCSLGATAGNAMAIAEDLSNNKPIETKLLRWGAQLEPDQRQEAVVLFGPSGAGKTSMAAKLATHFKLQAVDAAFLSLDTDRMCGLNSLQIYADALHIPCIPIRQAEDIKTGLKKAGNARLLILDTEGWSSRHPSAIKKLTETLRLFPSTRRFIVMPANIDESDAMDLLNQSWRLNPTDLVISKLDETGRPGKLLNLAIASGLALSYCSSGMEVPDDMGWLTPESLTSVISAPNPNSPGGSREQII